MILSTTCCWESLRGRVPLTVLNKHNIFLWLNVLRNHLIPTWWCFANIPTFKKKGHGFKEKWRKDFLLFLPDLLRLREECDSYHGYRATASLATQSIPVLPPDQWLLPGYTTIIALQSITTSLQRYIFKSLKKMRAIFFDFTGAAVLVKGRSLINYRRLASFPRLIKHWNIALLKREETLLVQNYPFRFFKFYLAFIDKVIVIYNSLYTSFLWMKQYKSNTCFHVTPVHLEEIIAKLNCEDQTTRPLRCALGFMDILNKVNNDDAV
jgi:hypothetical protein